MQIIKQNIDNGKIRSPVAAEMNLSLLTLNTMMINPNNQQVKELALSFFKTVKSLMEVSYRNYISALANMLGRTLCKSGVFYFLRLVIFLFWFQDPKGGTTGSKADSKLEVQSYICIKAL